MAIPFDNQYVRLSTSLFTPQQPASVRKPDLIALNRGSANTLGIDAEWLSGNEGVAVLAGNRIPEGAEPIATVYGGHQFGHWNPQLGDGRAILLGEVVGQDGRRCDIQLKGAGRTRYSRSGDGRSPLGPVLREYLVSEAMAALGVPTTRSLAAVATGEKVLREEVLAGGVLTRVASSHIRIGTFQYFAAREDWESVQLLADHVIERHYPACLDAEQPYLALLQAVIAAQAELVAQWQSLGFIHGVMNTDNMLVCGETVDYGPCAFMDHYDPKTVFSFIDRNGRYAYGNQPRIAQWNLAWLARALLPLLEDQEQSLPEVQASIDQFVPLYNEAYRQRMARKLGFEQVDEESEALLDQLVEVMEAQRLDFTLTFRALIEYLDPACCVTEPLYQLPSELDVWLNEWRHHLDHVTSREQAKATMLAANPLYIPRNHRVEAVIEAAYRGDLAPFHQLLDRVLEPQSEESPNPLFAAPPTEQERVANTFCGT